MKVNHELLRDAMLEGPVRLPVSPFRRSPPAVQKIKRGGTGKVSSSGNAARRFYTPVIGLRVGPKKPGKHDGGTLAPKPPQAPIIWDPSIYAAMPKPEPRKRLWTRHAGTAPRTDPIYARKRALRAQGLTRREVRTRMAHERA